MHRHRERAQPAAEDRARAGAWTATTKIDVSGCRDQRPGRPARLALGGARTTSRRSSSTAAAPRLLGRAPEHPRRSTGSRATATATRARAPVPAASYLRISSDGAANPSCRRAYSEDGTTWTPPQARFHVEGSGPAASSASRTSPATPGASPPFDYFQSRARPRCATPDTTAAGHRPHADAHGGERQRLVHRLAAGRADRGRRRRRLRRADRPSTGSTAVRGRRTRRPSASRRASTRSTTARPTASGNAEAAKSFSVKVDPAAPTTTAALDPAQPGPGGTYDGPVTVSLAATDGDGGSGIERPSTASTAARGRTTPTPPRRSCSTARRRR